MGRNLIVFVFDITIHLCSNVHIIVVQYCSIIAHFSKGYYHKKLTMKSSCLVGASNRYLIMLIIYYRFVIRQADDKRHVGSQYTHFQQHNNERLNVIIIRECHLHTQLSIKDKVLSDFNTINHMRHQLGPDRKSTRLNSSH